MSCCEPIFLGCFNSCNNIQLPFTSDYTGLAYFIQTVGQKRSYKIGVEEGEFIVIPANILNESALITFEIEKLDGTKFEYEETTCFQIRTEITVGGSDDVIAPSVSDYVSSFNGRTGDVVFLCSDLPIECAGTAATWPTITGDQSTVNLSGFTNDSGFIAGSRLINTSGSLTGGGDLTADRTLSLVNDNATPGNSQYYGTDGTGTKGYFDLPTGNVYTINTQAVDYTLQLSDEFVLLTNAAPIEVTVPTNASVAYPIGYQIEIACYGTGTVEIVGDAGVTVNGTGSILSGQYTAATLTKIGANEWLLTGSLLPAGLLLDIYTGAAVAYSVRKLSNAYGGAAMRVRRSSDDTEMDIGFDGNDLDTAALLAFVGAGDGFVTTWYDQSGNGRDLAQADEAKQVRIVNSGVLDTVNGIAAPRGDGSNDGMLSPSGVFGTLTNFAAFTVAKYNSVAATTYLWTCDNGGLGGSNNCITLGNLTSTSFRSLLNNGTGFTSIANPPGDTDHHLFTVIYEGGVEHRIGVDGVDASVGTGFATITPTSPMVLFAGSSSAVSVNAPAHIQEHVVFDSDESANRAGIEANINEYFGVY